MKTHETHYTLREALDVLDRPVPKWLSDPASQRNDASSWAGATWQGARQMAERGDLKTLRNFDAAARRLAVKDIGEARKRTSRRSVAGGAVDLGAYLSGAPDCMVEQAVVSGPRKVIQIGVRVEAIAAVTPNQLAERGCAIGGIVRALTLRGFSVGIDAIFAAERTAGIITAVTLKAPGEYLDPAIMAFWLGHPAAMRRVFFRLQEEAPEEIARAAGVGEGYGHPMKNLCTSHDILIPEANTSYTAKRYAEHYQRIFNAAGIQVKAN